MYQNTTNEQNDKNQQNITVQPTNNENEPTEQENSITNKVISKIIESEKSRKRLFDTEKRVFITKLFKELKNFHSFAPHDQALVFQPLSGYHRYLIHRVVELGFIDKGLTSFSIGNDTDRRAVICFEENSLHEDLKRQQEIEENREENQNRVERVGEDKISTQINNNQKVESFSSKGPNVTNMMKKEETKLNLNDNNNIQANVFSNSNSQNNNNNNLSAQISTQATRENDLTKNIPTGLSAIDLPGVSNVHPNQSTARIKSQTTQNNDVSSASQNMLPHSSNISNNISSLGDSGRSGGPNQITANISAMHINNNNNNSNNNGQKSKWQANPNAQVFIPRAAQKNSNPQQISEEIEESIGSNDEEDRHEDWQKAIVEKKKKSIKSRNRQPKTNKSSRKSKNDKNQNQNQNFEKNFLSGNRLRSDRPSEYSTKKKSFGGRSKDHTNNINQVNDYNFGRTHESSEQILRKTTWKGTENRGDQDRDFHASNSNSHHNNNNNIEGRYNQSKVRNHNSHDDTRYRHRNELSWRSDRPSRYDDQERSLAPRHTNSFENGKSDRSDRRDHQTYHSPSSKSVSSSSVGSPLPKPNNNEKNFNRNPAANILRQIKQYKEDQKKTSTKITTTSKLENNNENSINNNIISTPNKPTVVLPIESGSKFPIDVDQINEAVIEQEISKGDHLHKDSGVVMLKNVSNTSRAPGVSVRKYPNKDLCIYVNQNQKSRQIKGV